MWDNQNCYVAGVSIRKLFAASSERKHTPACDPVIPLLDNMLKRNKCLVHPITHKDVHRVLLIITKNWK